MPNFPEWDALYRQGGVEHLPWFHPALDPDLDRALGERSLTSSKALDIGTGPATQALALAAAGFDIVGTDISPAAVERAAALARERGLTVRFVQDDILDTKLSGPFDFAFDRGCFHVLAPDQRGHYAHTVARLLAPGGFLFLKCFSDEQPGTEGPYRFRPDDIRATFAPDFEIVAIERTIYQGTLTSPPRALFCTLQRVG